MKYDLNSIAKDFIEHQIDSTRRAELVKEMGELVRYPSKPIQLLLAQVAHECIEQPGCTPVITIQIGVMYGLVLGVLCEEERAARKRIV
jgi:hypothetical protein